MAIIYEEGNARSVYTGPFVKPNYARQWARHYENYRFLKLVFERTTDPTERRQANKEMGVATAKMDLAARLADAGAIRAAKADADRAWDAK